MIGIENNEAWRKGTIEKGEECRQMASDQQEIRQIYLARGWAVTSKPRYTATPPHHPTSTHYHTSSPPHYTTIPSHSTTVSPHLHNSASQRTWGSFHIYVLAETRQAYDNKWKGVLSPLMTLIYRRHIVCSVKENGVGFFFFFLVIWEKSLKPLVTTGAEGVL